MIALIRLYRAFLAPVLPASCRFEPTCSAYAVEAVARHGAFWGALMALWRLLRCNPFCRGGYDPVPESVAQWRSGILWGRRGDGKEATLAGKGRKGDGSPRRSG